MVLTLLPLLAWGLLALLAARLGLDWRRALLAASLGWGVLAALLAEGLGAAGQLQRGPLAAAWAGSLLLAALLLARLPRRDVPPTPRAPWTGLERALWGALALLGLGVLTAALASAPNSADGISYHLPRLRHWAAQGSLAHYPTTIARQLYMAPWAEVAGLHLQLLGESDRLLGCVEAFSWAACGLVASLLAAQLGAPRPIQLGAALALATIPVGLLQASGTQNNCVAAFWLSGALCALLEVRSAGSQRAAWGWLLGVAAGLGLALATKGTVFVLGASYCVLGAWVLVRRWRGAAWQPLFATCAVVAVLALPHHVRNARAFADPFGPEPQLYRNDPVGPTALVVNALRNGACHLGSPLPGGNRVAQGVVNRLGRLGLPVHARGYTWRDAEFHVSAMQTDEGFAGSPFHLLALLVALPLALVRWRRDPPRWSLPFVLLGAATAGALVFCLALRWQPWGTRLTLPLFACALPPALCVLRGGPRWALPALGAIVTALALYPLGWSFLRPLVGEASVLRSGRAAEVFRAHPGWRSAHEELLPRIAGRERVGLVAHRLAHEYRLWALSDELPAAVRPRFEHWGTATQRLYGGEARGPTEPPEWVVFLELPCPARAQIGGRAYRLEWSREPVGLYRRE